LSIVADTLQKRLTSTAYRSLLKALINRGGDFVWFGGPTSEWTIIPLCTEACSWTDFKAMSLSAPLPSENTTLPFIGGFIGAIPYEQFSPFDDGPIPILMRAKGALLCHNNTGTCTVTARRREDYKAVRHLTDDLVEQALSRDHHGKKESMSLVPNITNDQYESMVKQALSDISDGRYYQINLLRYFQCLGISQEGIIELLMSRGGPFACWFSQGEHEIISFSPEHFVKVTGLKGNQHISTFPIKGTSLRHNDRTLDEKSALELRESKKDLAELHMIIDLMRNDLNKICRPGSVQVLEANKLMSFVNVHHLVGSLTGRLVDDLTVNDFFSALCPGGSITGAPKIEVMHAIRQYERRPRGFFMGHAFMLDDNGTFNSSILIRTLQKAAGKDYEFAAGSGIVIHSDPRSERLEIDGKCNVVTY